MCSEKIEAAPAVMTLRRLTGWKELVPSLSRYINHTSSSPSGVGSGLRETGVEAAGPVSLRR